MPAEDNTYIRGAEGPRSKIRIHTNENPAVTPGKTRAPVFHACFCGIANKNSARDAHGERDKFFDINGRKQQCSSSPFMEGKGELS